MPNHVMNRLHLSGDQERINKLLESVKGEDSVLDFNRIIPMPETLNIECGSRTDRGLKAYKDFVYVRRNRGKRPAEYSERKRGNFSQDTTGY